MAEYEALCKSMHFVFAFNDMTFYIKYITNICEKIPKFAWFSKCVCKYQLKGCTGFHWKPGPMKIPCHISKIYRSATGVK